MILSSHFVSLLPTTFYVLLTGARPGILGDQALTNIVLAAIMMFL